MTHDPDGDKESVASRRYGGTDQRKRIPTTAEAWVEHMREILVKPYVPERMVRLDTGEPVTNEDWVKWRNL